MKFGSRALLALAVFTALGAVAVAGCGGATAAQPASPSPTAPPATPADITGTTHDVTQTAGDPPMPVLLVVDDGAIKGMLDRALVTVTSQTRFWMLKGGVGTPADLAPGQMVSVWFTGPVRESYPVQATAADVKILLED